MLSAWANAALNVALIAGPSSWTPSPTAPKSPVSKWRDSVTVPCVYTVTAYPPWPLTRQNQRSDHTLSLYNSTIPTNRREVPGRRGQGAGRVAAGELTSWSSSRPVWNRTVQRPPRSWATGATIADVIVEFMDDDKGYIAWLAGHPDGFVLNCERPPRPSYLILHRATCWTISRTSGSNWTVIYQKVCADTFEEINAWASQIGPPWRCGFCGPQLTVSSPRSRHRWV